MTAESSADPQGITGPSIIARLERLKGWSLSYGFLVIIGLGFLFTFYDIFDINVSFVQTCVGLKPGCTPETALESLPLPVALNLAGYVAGTLVLSPVADKVGRRNMLLITMLITGLGSLYNALAPDYANFVIARVVTGIGIGADLAIVNTYINEVSPRQARARFTTLIFINSSVGALIGIWLGLILTTEKAPWPLGLPFAVAGPSFTIGWRWMYGIGAILALVAILLRFRLPESPRWLIGQKRLGDADAVVRDMEDRASRRGPLAEPNDNIPTEAVTPPTPVPYSTLFTNPLYLRRMLLLVAIWFIGYITVYSYASGFTSVLSALKYPPPEAGVITAVGSFGFVGMTILMTFIVEKLERRYWLPVGAAVTLLGAFLIAGAGTHVPVALIGSVIAFAGFNMWVSPTYALSAESFPTRARTTGFALVDGVGHIGGGIGILAIAPLLPHLSTLGALVLISIFLVIAAILAQFTTHTRARDLDHISP
jgi:MFS family permease